VGDRVPDVVPCQRRNMTRPVHNHFVHVLHLIIVALHHTYRSRQTLLDWTVLPESPYNFLPKIRLRAGFPSSKLAGAITSLLTLLFILYYYISPSSRGSTTSGNTAQISPPSVCRQAGRNVAASCHLLGQGRRGRR
jgi:hypothetical protein